MTEVHTETQPPEPDIPDEAENQPLLSVRVTVSELVIVGSERG